VFALVESGVGDLAQSFQIAAQGPDVAPGDILRCRLKCSAFKGGEANQDGVDVALTGDEGGKGVVIVWGSVHQVAPVLVTPYMF
jgi:hypothetical protein